MAPESILDIAVDQGLGEPSNFLSGETVLKKAIAAKVPTTVGSMNLNIRPIDLGPKQIEDAINGKIAEAAASVVNNIVNNYNSQSTVNQDQIAKAGNSTFNNQNFPVSSTVSNQVFPGNVLNTELASIVNSIKSEEVAMQSFYSSLTNIQPTIKEAAESVNLQVSQIPLATPKEIFQTVSNSTNNVTSDSNQMDFSYLLREISNIEQNQNIINEETSTVKNTSNSLFDSQKTNRSLETNEDVTSVKSTKLAETSTIKSALSPDTSLVTQVENLTKVLPDTINNLTNAVSSITQQNSANSNVTNEGNKIDQSTNTTITQMGPQPVNTKIEEAAKPAAQEIGQDGFYLQAIYQALISGKIKVRLDYQ